MASLSLAIPHEVQGAAKRDGKVLRWFLDKPGRIAEAHADDWDVVDGMNQVAAGQDEERKLVLMEKYKDWHDDDEQSQVRNLRDREDALVAGTSRENREQGDELAPASEFRSLPRNRISRDRG